MIPELTTKEIETLKAQADARKNPKSAEAFFHMAFSQSNLSMHNYLNYLKLKTLPGVKKNKYGHQHQRTLLNL